MNKLNLGCGYVTPDDWDNVDKIEYNGDVLVADVLKGLPFQDNHFDFILMNHTLQMFHYDELPIVLSEVKRVMKSSATLRILTPDVKLKMYSYFDPSIRMHISNDIDVPISKELEPTEFGRLMRWIFWHGDTHCAFSEESLADLLERNGFKHGRIGAFGECELDSRENESLIMEAMK